MTKTATIPRDPDHPEVTYQYRCPKCGDAHHIDVIVTAWTRLLPADKADQFTRAGALWSSSQVEACDGNDEFDERSEASCQVCDHEAPVADFINPDFKEG